MAPVQEIKKAGWLEEARRLAWSEFRRAPAPDKTVETWRRADFGRWRTDLLTDKSAETLLGPVSERPGVPALDGRAGGFRQCGNRLPASISLDPELSRRSVLLTSLEEAARRHPGLVEPYLKGLSASRDFQAFESANLALFKGGAFLYVPEGLRIEKPFELTFSHDPDASFCFPRVLAVLGEGAQAAIVEGHSSGQPDAPRDAGRLSSIAFSRLVVGSNAEARWFYDQSLPLDTAHFWHQQADLGSGALLRHYSALLGAAIHKSELDVRLRGTGARSELFGLLLGAGDQQFDPRTVQRHERPKTTSDLLFRAALKGRARSVYTGLIRIEKETAGCDAYQQNNNLLLSNEARADSTPVLEILTNDVRCKHGATVGPVSQDELFYLCSRGLAPEEAMKMLVLGFFDPILSRLPLERRRKRIAAEIEERLA